MSFNNDHMGQIVTVFSEVVRTRRAVQGEEPERRLTGYNHLTYPRSYVEVEWEERPKPNQRAGWVTGFRYLQNGKIHFQHTEHPFFQVSDTVPVVLVAYWPTMNPVRVPIHAYKLGGEPASPTQLSQNYARARGWYDHGEEMKRIMEDWPRDEKGRWLPKER